MAVWLEGARCGHVSMCSLIFTLVDGTGCIGDYVAALKTARSEYARGVGGRQQETSTTTSRFGGLVCVNRLVGVSQTCMRIILAAN